MRKKTAKALYGSVIDSGSGKLVYNLLNPISRQAWSGSGGKMYRAIYVVNPMDGGAISRLQISDEDVSRVNRMMADESGDHRALIDLLVGIVERLVNVKIRRRTE